MLLYNIGSCTELNIGGKEQFFEAYTIVFFPLSLPPSPSLSLLYSLPPSLPLTPSLPHSLPPSHYLPLSLPPLTPSLPLTPFLSLLHSLPPSYPLPFPSFPPSQPHLEKLGVAELYPKTGFSDENLKLYLQNPPPGECVAALSPPIAMATKLIQHGNEVRFHSSGKARVGMGLWG